MSEDQDPFPFRSHHLDLDEGRIHYVDEGEGHPLVFVHGNPEWSFSFRNVIRPLSQDHRCIAPDHMGFGLSDKPFGADLTPKAHAERLTAFLDVVDIRSCTLVMNDWGGPIGFAVAEADPARICGLVVLNSWLWPLRKSPLLQLYSRVMGGPFGRWTIRKGNILIRWGMPWGFARPSRFDARLRERYERPFRDPRARRGQWVFARHILKAGPWFQKLWEERRKLAGKPLLILKGTEDPAFSERNLRKWQQGFPRAEFMRIKDAGHFPHEEQGEKVAEAIRDHMEREA